MRKVILIFILVLGVNNGHAQDERLFRQMLSGELTRDYGQVEKSLYYFKAASDFYEFDFNDDKRSEKIQFSKKDGEDWMAVFDQKGKRVFKYRFETKGIKSRAFKISVRQLSKKSKLFMIYFFEGFTKYLESQGTGRLYFLTIDDKKLTTLSMHKGPYFFEEFKSFKGHYHQRKHDVSLYDFNKDGTRDVAVRYNLTTRVFFYDGNGKWNRFKQKFDDF